MLELKSILNFVLTNVKDRPDLFEIIDDEHVLHTVSHVKFHMYDDSFYMTHGDDKIVNNNYFNKEEREIVLKIKELITDPAVSAKRAADYPRMIKEGRERLAGLFENPQPVIIKGPVIEEGTTQYTG